MTLLPNSGWLTVRVHSNKSQPCDAAFWHLTSNHSYQSPPTTHCNLFAHCPHHKLCQPPMPQSTTRDQPYCHTNCCPNWVTNMPCQHSKRVARRNLNKMRREMKNGFRRGRGVKGQYLHSYYSTDTLITLQDLEKGLRSQGSGFSCPLMVHFLLSIILLTISFFFRAELVLEASGVSITPPPPPT